MLSNILFILKNLKHYLKWLQIKYDFKTIKYEKGLGFYIVEGLGRNPYKIYRSKKIRINKNIHGSDFAIFDLVDYNMAKDPRDMVKYSIWTLIKYENTKPIKECSFEEYISIYAHTLKQVKIN